MELKANSRQMPKQKMVVSDKEYCDLLYAYLQCISEFNGGGDRILEKRDCKWAVLERGMSRVDDLGNEMKIMDKRTIKKYFQFLVDKGFIIDYDASSYRLSKLDSEEACLIEYNTLCKFVNVFKRHSISIYIYLFNKYYATGFDSYLVTYNQIKNYIGFCQSTDSNTQIIKDTLDILKDLGLLDYTYEFQQEKSYIRILWVKNSLG